MRAAYGAAGRVPANADRGGHLSVTAPAGLLRQLRYDPKSKSSSATDCPVGVPKS